MADRSLGYSVTAVDRASATFVKMALQVDRLAERLDRLDRKRANPTVDVDTKPAQRKIETLDKSFGAATIRVAALGRAMSAISMPAAITASIPMLASLGATAIQASGSLLLLPAAGAAGAVAMGALKVGTQGFGDAMKQLDDPKKFAEAIAKLSPAAREAAVTVRSLVPAWTAMKNVVQDNLFAGVSRSIGELAGTYLPLLRAGLGATATQFNGFLANFVAFATVPQTLTDIPVIFTNVNTAIGNLSPIVNNLLGTFRDIAVVGSAFLPALATGAVNATQRFQTFIHTARETGQLALWIQGGLDVLRQLGQIAVNVGSILGSIFGAGQRAGESFLSILVRVTGQLAAALRSPQGAAALQQTFVIIRTVVAALWEKLVALWPAISAAGQALGALLMAVAPLSGVLTGVVVAGLVPMLKAIEFLAPVLGPLIALWGAYKTVMWAVNTATVAYRSAAALATAVQVGWQLAMGTSTALTEAQVAAMNANAVATKIAQGAALAWQGTQWLLAAALDGTLVSLIGQKVAALGMATWSAVARGATLAWTAVQWLLNAALTANPIGIVVVAIAALVAAFVLAWNNSETFRAIVIGAWEQIKATAQAVFGWLTGFLSATWNSIVAGVTTAWNGVVNFFTTVGGAIAGFFTGLGSAIASAVSFIIGIPGQIAQHWGEIVAFFQGLPAKIVHALGFLAGFLLRSAIESWMAFTSGLETAWNATAAFFTALPGRIGAFFVNLGVQLLAWAITSWTAFTNGLETAWGATVAFFTALPGRIVSFLTQLGATLLMIAINSWAAFTSGLQTAWNDTVAFFTGLPGRIVAFLATLAVTLASIATSSWTAFTSGLEAAWSGTVSFFTSLPGRIVAFLQGLGDTLMGASAASWDGFTAGLETAWTATVGFFTALPGEIGGFFADAGNWLLQVGLDLVAGLWQGLVNAWNGLMGWIGGLIASFIGGFKEGLGIASPSTIFAQIGQWLIDGLIAGLQAAASALWSIVTTLTTGLVNAVMAGVNFLGGLWNSFWSGLSGVVSGAWSAIVGAVQAAWAWLQSVLQFAGLTSMWDGFWNGLMAVVNVVWSVIQAVISIAWTAIRGVFQAFMALLSGDWNGFWQILTSTAQALFAQVSAVVAYAWAGIQAIFGGAIAFLVGVWTSFWSGIQAAALAAWTLITTAVQTGWALVTGAFNAAIAFVVGIWNSFWANVQLAVTVAWTLITAAVQAGWAMITGAFNAAIAFVVGLWNSFWSGLQAFVTVVWTGIQLQVQAGWAILTGAFNAAVAFLTGLWTTFWAGLQAVAVATWNAVSGFFTGAFNAFVAFFSAIWNGMLAFFTAVWTGIQLQAVTLWTAISVFFTSALNAFVVFFQAIWNGILAFFITVWTSIQAQAIALWNAISAFFTGAFNAFVAFFRNIWNSVVAFFVERWETLKAGAIAAWNGIKAFFEGAFSAFTKFFSDTWNRIVDTFQRIWSGITDIAKRVWENVKGAFKTGINAIIDVINGFAGAINKVAGLLGFTINLGIPRLQDGGPIAGLRDGGEIHYRQVIHRATGGGVNAARGGALPNTGTRRDTLPARAGRQPYLLAGKEYIVRRSSTEAIGPSGMAAINNADRRPVDVVPRRSGGPIAVNEDTVRAHGPFLAALADQQAEAVQAARIYGGPQRMVTALDEDRFRASRTAGGEHKTMPGYRQRGLDAIGLDLGGAIAFAKSMNGRPYIWGGGTPAGTDCSGYQGMITSVLRNQAPHRIGTTDTFPWPGFTPGLTSRYAIGAFKGSPGHMAGTLDRVNVESGGRHGNVAYGGPAAGADNGQFRIRASLPEVGGQFASGGGGAGFQDLIGPIVESLLGPLRAKLLPIRDNAAEGFGKRTAAGAGLKIIDYFVQKAAAADAQGGATGPAGVGPVADQVRAVANRFGWGAGPEWDAISWIIGKESSWNPNAKNPGSTAYGLFQLLGANQGLAGKSSNPGLQTEAGLNYIKSRYGTPTKARQFWEAHGYYDDGGEARDRGIMLKRTIHPERVLSPRQTRQHERLTAVLEKGSVQRLLASAEQMARRSPVMDQVRRIQSVQQGAPAMSVQVDMDSVKAEVAGLRADFQGMQRAIEKQRPITVNSVEPAETGQAVALRLRM